MLVKPTNKIEWLAVLQGWSMLLVVLGHNVLTIPNDPNFPITSAIIGLVYSFHMPLFMFISGYLYYFTKLRKDKPYVETIKEKLVRLGIPFMVFTVVTLFAKIALSSMMLHPAELSLGYFVDTFVLYKINPLVEMWFVITLFVLMLLYPIYKWSLANKQRMFLVFAVSLLVYYFAPRTITLFQLNNVADMFFFFYCGILFSKFELPKMFDNWYSLIITFTLFVVLIHFHLDLFFIKVMGILFSLSLCVCCSRFFPNLFSSFRNYTYQIFLLGVFFQVAVRWFYTKLNMEVIYLPCYILGLLIALYIPVAISYIVIKIDNKYLKASLGLK